MEYGQPPSWRPDVEQSRAEAYRGTVRDALGGLRNLEQLLGSLRVGPRALSSVLPDVCSSCIPLAESIGGLLALIVSKLSEAEGVANNLRQLMRQRLDTLTRVLESVEQQALNAKNRLRVEEAVSGTTRDIEAIVELIDMLGEAAWGRAMPLRVSEVVREAYRGSDPVASSQPAVRLILVNGGQSGECVVSPRALVLILHHLARWSVERVPTMTPVVEISQTETQHVEMRIRQATVTGEVRWAPGRHLLPVSEDALRIAARAMHLRLDLMPESGEARVEFPSTPTTVT